MYEIAEHESQPFIAMECLEGQTLKQRLGVGADGVRPLSPGEPFEGARRAPLQIVLNVAGLRDRLTM